MPGSKAPFPDRESIAAKLSSMDDAARSWLMLVLENPAQDDAFLEGLLHFLNEATSARFLNTLKLGKAGEWLGTEAPDRLQARLMETAKSSLHPAFAAFRDGLVRSGGLERAFPKSEI